MLSTLTDNTNDEVLFQRIQAGDVKAFDVLFMRYYPLLCAYAKRFVDFDDGQEIVQDVMVWFWENSSMQVIETSPKKLFVQSCKEQMPDIDQPERTETADSRNPVREYAGSV